MSNRLASAIVASFILFGAQSEAADGQIDADRYFDRVDGTVNPEKLSRGKTIRAALWAIGRRESDFSARDFHILISARDASYGIDYQMRVNEMELAIQLCDEYVLDRAEMDVDPVAFARAIRDGEDQTSSLYDGYYEALIVNLSVEGKAVFENTALKDARQRRRETIPNFINQATDFPVEIRNMFIKSCEASKDANIGEIEIPNVAEIMINTD